MRRLIASFVLALAFGISGCGPSISKLPADEQIQALVLDDLAGKFYSDRPARKVYRFVFLSVWTTADTDPSMKVQEFVRKRFPSARPCSASAIAEKHAQIIDQSTGQEGVLVGVESKIMTGDGPIVVTAFFRVHDGFGEVHEYTLQRVQGNWRITALRMTLISGRSDPAFRRLLQAFEVPV